jgi:hypothetical protein
MTFLETRVGHIQSTLDGRIFWAMAEASRDILQAPGNTVLSQRPENLSAGFG